MAEPENPLLPPKDHSLPDFDAYLPSQGATTEFTRRKPSRVARKAGSAVASGFLHQRLVEGAAKAQGQEAVFTQWDPAQKPNVYALKLIHPSVCRYPPLRPHRRKSATGPASSTPAKHQSAVAVYSLLPHEDLSSQENLDVDPSPRGSGTPNMRHLSDPTLVKDHLPVESLPLPAAHSLLPTQTRL
ncbi:hypothetical protein LTR70_003775 [Exophiala xenobiotica]|uniref:Uncharacterized protein n=1 Tax=Lithohypha guttulata TaxID=1690604 RepID=A0ABR0KF81_9EURO|nr:hypothetical protein LTR24_003358 [Lithohypha guttulata]KAK5322274.1 hypothetical protein LTR70_003775 [Exophiala xenobiotica]